MDGKEGRIDPRPTDRPTDRRTATEGRSDLEQASTLNDELLIHRSLPVGLAATLEGGEEEASFSGTHSFLPRPRE